MKRAGHLFERIADFGALCAAARRAARGKELSDEAAGFMMELEPEVLVLERELLDGSYRPRSYRSFMIRDPKPRRISAATFRDRVVHHALCAVLEPVFEREASADSYACRRGRGVHAAVRRAQVLCRRSAWYLKLDVRHFFETVDHRVLKARLRRRVKDRRVLSLAALFIDAGAPGSPAGLGMPIGNLTSQHFANFYLTPLDRFVREALRAPGYVRYMDDLLLFAPDRHTARAWRGAVRGFVEERLRLHLRPDAERLAPVTVGVPFLGFRIWPRLIRLDKARARRLARRLRALEGLDEAARIRTADSLIGWAVQAASVRLRGAILDGRAGGG